jgi:pyruvate,water dikinase
MGTRLIGTGVGSAPIEGDVRVVLEPAHCQDLDFGEILVCPFTDPSWTPVFAVAAGLVLDSGGPMSHGAIIARELGLPCVIGVEEGTTRLRTGDRVRLDPADGTVELLRSATVV